MDPATTMDAANALRILRGFIGPSQLSAIGQACRGEERQWFRDKLVELAGIVSAMPHTYQQDGKGDEATVFLHYFAGGMANFYITEKDREDEQRQAFGLSDLYDDGGELGYISLVELLDCGAELDLHWTPKSIGSVKAKERAT